MTALERLASQENLKCLLSQDDSCLISVASVKRALKQEQTNTINYRRAFKIACDLLNGDVLYGVDTDKIYELMIQKDGVVSSSSYEEYILNHLQELDQGQYASNSEKTNKSETKIDCEHTDCNNCVNHKYCDYEPTTENDLPHCQCTDADFDILHFVADNAGLSTFEAIEKAYNMGVSEQEPILDKIRAEIEQRPYGIANDSVIQGMKYERAAVLAILDKCKAESEVKDGNNNH